jgi:acetyl-CoA acetyltransferase
LARNAYISMIETAQNVADRYGLTREEIDAFALRSQRRAAAARDSGRLAKEIMPVPIPATKKTPARVFEHDEFIRDDTTAQRLAALPAQSGSRCRLVTVPSAGTFDVFNCRQALVKSRRRFIG